MNNLSSYCGLVDAKIRASDKDLPVQMDFAVNKMKLSMNVMENMSARTFLLKKPIPSGMI